MNDRLSALRLFVRVARLGSFSRAAREANLSQPSVSRIIADLERGVGVALLTRTTRAVVLTEAGEDYLAHVEPILAALDEADHAVRGTGELRGQLKVGLSSSVAVRGVVPLLADFMARHPALRIDLLIDDQRQDLLLKGVDVALRFGPLADSTATARLVTASPRVLVAAPAYLARAGTPQAPADLPGHAILLGPSSMGAASWTFERDGGRVSVRVDGRLNLSVNEAGTAAAVAGLGLFLTGRIGCDAELASGTLVRVLPDWTMGMAEIYAVFPAGRAAKPAARLFAEHLASALAVDP